MRIFRIALAMLFVSTLVLSCKPKKKEMTLKDFAKIEDEISLPSPEVDKKLVEEVTGKYGYTYDQYKEMFDKVEKDPSLREKLGEMKLQEEKLKKE